MEIAPKQNNRNQGPENSFSYLISFWRALKLGLTNFWRNKFLSIATIMVIAVILFIFNTILAVHFIANQGLQALSQRVDIVIYLRDDINMEDAQKLTQATIKIPGVKSAKYTSKEEALTIVSKTHPKTADFLKKFDLINPLPPSISIITERPEDYKNIQNFLEEGPYKNLMKNFITQGGSEESVVLSSIAKNLGNIGQFVRQIIFWIILIFVLGGTLVIVNAIQLTIYTRRQEISIMRLVGATPGFIRLPFILEGILYSIAAVLLSFIFLAILGKTLQIQETNLLSYYNDLQLNKVFLAEIIMTTLVGIISSFSAVEQYLKNKANQN